MKARLTPKGKAKANDRTEEDDDDSDDEEKGGKKASKASFGVCARANCMRALLAPLFPALV
jgi:hypothetical protein